jgi:hypothetical protein
MSSTNESPSQGTDTALHSGEEALSAPASPTDTRHPLSRYETVVEEDEEATSGTDTIRRRPEPNSYGKFANYKPRFYLHHGYTSWVLTSVCGVVRSVCLHSLT